MGMEKLLNQLNPYVTECDECGNLMPLDKWFVDHLYEMSEKELASLRFLQIENGLCIDVNGYYGGFTDQMAQFDESVDPLWHLCHDCCVKLFETFPNSAARLGNMGHHPYDTPGEPCCKWGWTFIHDDDGTIIGTEYGGVQRLD